MDDTTRETLIQFIIAVRAFAKSVEKSLFTGTFEGIISDVMVKKYLGLQARAIQLLPEDFYIKDVLSLDIPENADDHQKTLLINLSVGQLLEYLEELIRAEDKTQPFFGPFPHGRRPDFGHFGHGH